MTDDIKIGNIKIGKEEPPFIIAELSGNHNQSLDRVLAMVEEAAKAGVHAIKLQTYTPDTMTLDIKDKEFLIKDTGNLWAGYSLYELYKKAHTPWEWHETIFKRCKELGLIAFSSPFDITAVEHLEKLNVPCYKIASFENVDIPLIKRVAETGKPIIMSTGMASLAEIDEAVQTVKNTGNKNLTLLKCTTTYPASPDESNLLTIPHMKDLFSCHVGLSDHTLGIGTAISSVALGARVIEKHFTLSRTDGGVDAAFSLEPHELRQLVLETKRGWESLGGVKYGPTKKERQSIKRRRSLYVTKDLQAGEILNYENVKSIRPGLGLPPKYLDILVGKKVSVDVKRGTPLSWELI